MAEKDLQRQVLLDPAVMEIMAAMQEKQAESRLPRRVRERKARERAKMRARREQRVTYDIPPFLKQSVFELAESLSLPASQLAALALFRFLSDYRQGEIDLSKFKKPSRSPRYDWKLVFPQEWLTPDQKV
jgi:hypothetical protein